MRKTDISVMKKCKDNEIDLAEHQKTLLNLWKNFKRNQTSSIMITNSYMGEILVKILAAKPL